jgi:F-type H+-transporting ATPase subunit b
MKLGSTICAVVLWLLMLGNGTTAFAFEGGKGGHVDPTHAHASAESDSLLEFKSDKAIFTVAVFLLLCTGLYFAAWKPISQGLARRETMISSRIADAERASLEAAAKLKEYQSKLEDAAVQAQELVNQAKKDAEAVAERIKTDAETNALRTVERARSEIESAKQTALAELSTKSTDLAFGLARKMIGRELQAGDHQRLINEALGRLPNDN